MVFLTDNGPAFPRYNARFSRHKGTVYEGGIRVPCYARGPAGSRRARGRPDRGPYRRRAHVPGRMPGSPHRPVCTSTDRSPSLCSRANRRSPGRTGPSVCSGTAAMPRWSLAATLPPVLKRSSWWARSFRGSNEAHPALELYDLEHDPFELKDIAKEHPETVARLHADYQSWFRDVSSTRGYAPGAHPARHSSGEPDCLDPSRLAWTEGQLEPQRSGLLGG